MGGCRYGTLDIIIPVYNKEKYLRRCVKSALDQTYTPDRVILVDDGSLDDSPRICDELASENSIVSVIHKKNGGASSARNAGLEVSAGDYVGFLDADDWADEDMYEKLITALNLDTEYDTAPASKEKSLLNILKEDSDDKKQNNGRVTGAGLQTAQLMNRQYKSDGTLALDVANGDGKTRFLAAEDFYEELIMHTGDSSFCTKVFRGDFLRSFRFSEGESNEDFGLLLNMIPKMGAGLLTLDVPGYNIELSDGSVTRGKYNQKFYEDMMKNAFGALRVAREKYPSHITRAERFTYVQSLDFMLHIPVEKMKSSNAFYMRIVRYLRSERAKISKNPYLSQKQREYLLLLTDAPLVVRTAHNVVMRIRDGKASE